MNERVGGVRCNTDECSSIFVSWIMIFTVFRCGVFPVRSHYLLRHISPRQLLHHREHDCVSFRICVHVRLRGTKTDHVSRVRIIKNRFLFYNTRLKIFKIFSTRTPRDFSLRLDWTARIMHIYTIGIYCVTVRIYYTVLLFKKWKKKKEIEMRA